MIHTCNNESIRTLVCGYPIGIWCQPQVSQVTYVCMNLDRVMDRDWYRVKVRDLFSHKVSQDGVCSNFRRNVFY